MLPRNWPPSERYFSGLNFACNRERNKTKYLKQYTYHEDERKQMIKSHQAVFITFHGVSFASLWTHIIMMTTTIFGCEGAESFIGRINN